MKGPFSESPRPRAYLQGATAQRIVCADYRGLPRRNAQPAAAKPIQTRNRLLGSGSVLGS